jgi:hypothetical protein
MRQTPIPPHTECIVGNIIGKHYKGVDKAITSGTKHFSAGTKVYCVFMYGGMGHGQIRVYGKLRHSFRMIDIVIRASFIKNFRLQKVYNPKILAFLNKYNDYAIDSNDGIETHINTLNSSNDEIKEDYAR